MAESARSLPVETFRGVVHPWHCDTMGHMNVRHYVGMFDDAGFQLLGEIAGSSDELFRQGRGWADVRHAFEYRHEARAGALVVIRSGIGRVGRTSVVMRHDMSDALTGTLLATAEIVTVLFDLGARRALALPDEFRDRALALATA
jgi:acyl-CoA thioester hydrolase